MNWRRLSSLAVILLVPLAILVAQGRGNGWPRYDPKTETTVKGTIQEVKELPSPRGAGTGTHLVLKTEAGNYDVHVGPTAFVTQQGFTFAKGDEVEVTGSKVKMGDTETLLAREIKKDGKTLTLRNSQGIPAWSRGGRGAS